LQTYFELFEIVFSALRQELGDLHTIYIKCKHQQIIIQNVAKIVAQPERWKIIQRCCMWNFYV